MCTGITFKAIDTYFGRSLDNEISYGEGVIITPRNYPFHFNSINKTFKSHYAIIGTAFAINNYPLYYEAINEKGLGMAGLNFVGNAYYQDKIEHKDNIAPFEFIPWILCQCTTVKEARKLLKNINLVNIPFSEKLPLAQLHWLIADTKEAITVEVMKEGINIYDNHIGVLTNNPPFNYQMFNLNNYMNVSSRTIQNKFSKKLKVNKYSRGLGGIGLPGDLSSQSRFVRVAFTKLNAVTFKTENENVNQFFHILGSVEQQKGSCDLGDNKYETTIYTSCYNLNKGIYYYTTYENHQIQAINMYAENLDSDELISFTHIREEIIKYNN